MFHVKQGVREQGYNLAKVEVVSSNLIARSIFLQ